MTAGEVSRKGLSLVTSQSMLIVAELAWRWAFAVGAIGIVLIYSSIVRDSISLSAADQGGLFSGDLLQMADVATRVAANALPFFVQAAEGALPKIALIWLLCITLGRSPLVRKIVGFTSATPSPANRRFWISITAVNAVRVLLVLIVLSAYLAANRISAIAFGTDPDQPRILLAMVAYFVSFGFGFAIFIVANFVASLAPLYVAQGRGALDALTDATHAAIRHKSFLGSTAAVNATLRTVVATVVTGVSILLLPMSRYLPSWILLVLAWLLTVVYCAASDILLLARTTAYALIVLGDTDSAAARGEGSLESPLYSAPPDLRS
jgi:hypothetical protein